MLQSFGVLDGDKIRPEGSKYAAYYIDQLKQLPPQGVINYSDIFNVKYDDQYEDKHFKINYLFTPIIFLSMVYAGYATMTLRNGTVLSASNLDTVPRIGVLDLYEFKYLARPAQMAMAELKKLFDVLEINPVLLDNPNDRDEGVKQLLKKAQETSNSAVLANQKLNNGFELWNEPLVDAQHLIAMQKACAAVKDEFSNYSARFNTPAKLNNFKLTFEEIDKLAEQITLIKAIAEYVTFKTDCANNVSYLSNIEFIDLGANFKQKLEAAKDEFRSARDSILTGTSGDAAAQKVNAALEKVKEEYIGIYFEEHKKKRLDIDDAKRRGKLQESSVLANLRKLRGVEILSAAKLTKIEQDMATARITTEVENIQFEMFVTNEKSAISWLYQQLDEQFCGPQTYAELQPKFMQEVKAVDKYEQMPELATILEENFLQDEKGRWYIPDVTKEGDLVKLREKNLWKEFEGYMNSKGKLKLFRSEAIRVGFSRLWKEKNYKAIVDIAERLPEQTIQEDSNLLMYYDISLGRV